MKRVLMVAFHFPPLAGSSGIQRTLRFVQQLPQHGWQPLVVTAHPRAYERTSTDMLGEIPDGCVVRRAQALDTARHLSLRGRYLAALARPDRWMTWKWDAIRQGLDLVRTYRPDVLWTTYPLATSHAIGLALHQRTGLPWVADFRDPMAQEGYPSDPQVWAAFKRIESETAARASACCFTTPSAARTYRDRYPSRADRMLVLENGYDEPTFARAEAALQDHSPLNPGCVTLLHSGIVYPSERDPAQLIEALSSLRMRGIDGTRLRVRFRASTADDLLRSLAGQHGVEDMVELLPPIPYADALTEMLRADALLVMQASNCNEQIPAKVYEYLRAGRPIITLTDPEGDTWRVLREAGLSAVARLDSAADIERLLGELLTRGFDGCLARQEARAAASRSARTVELAALLSNVCRP